MTRLSDAIVGNNKFNIPLLLAFIVAGLAGSYYNFEIFFNIDFLFGSIFAMLALQFLGFRRGILAAAIIASYTYFLWNHPYALVILTAEVAAVGWLMNRRKIGMVLADTLYWLIIGIPLVYLFYHLIMRVPHSNTFIVLIKQAINGIFNALVARLIFTGFTICSRSILMSYKEIISNLLALFVLLPSLALLAISSRNDFTRTETQIRTTLTQKSLSVTNMMETWVLNRKTEIIDLAELAASKSPKEMQTYLERAKRSDLNFLRIGLLDKDANTTAYYPSLDELGQSAIGKNFADRPFIPLLKQTLKPMLSEVVMGKIGIPKPIVLMLAPVVIRGEYSGYVSGTLRLQQIQEHLDKNADESSLLYSLLDKSGNIIMTNHPGQTVMKPLVHGKGTLNRLDNKISQWVPTVPPNTPVSEQWKKSFYISESIIGNLAEWKLILEQPIAPFQKRLYEGYSGKLAMLFLILLGSLALAELLSRKFVTALEQLRVLTYELPRKLATGCKETVWPESGITETNHLINNFREMADSLSKQFTETININKSLEWSVQGRTAQLDVTNTELLAEIAERKLVEKSLRKSEDLYHSLVETSQDLIWQCDAEGRYTYLNLAWEYEFGYELDEMLGKKFTDFQVPEVAERDLAEFKRVMQGNSVTCYESVYIGKAGNEIHLVFNALFRSDEMENIVGASGTAYVITERKQMENKLLEAKTLAEAASRAKSAFLSTMSHEIRTPLSALLGNISLLQETQLTPYQNECLNDCKATSQMLTRVINDVLDYSKIESGKFELVNENFSVSATCRQLIKMFSTSAKEAGLTLTVSLAENLPNSITCDQQRLRQIVANLLSNAIKFTRQGYVALEIACEQTNSGTDPDTAVLCIVVRDSGVGIPPDKLDQIFDSFTQLENFSTRTATGTGLGLAICRRLLTLMGGSISVSSVLENGTVFTVLIPVKTCQSEPLAQTLELAQAALEHPRNILLADDEEFGRSVVQKLLRLRGHTVTDVKNGIELLEALQKNDYDIVLTDISMPYMDGTEVAMIIRSGERKGINPQIPIIALTAHAFSEDRDHFIACGINSHIAKPIDLEKLLIKIEELCSKPPDIGETVK